MTPRPPHAHVVVRVSADEIILVRRVRQGRVYYIVPGVAVADGETPGVAATRAAREELGIDVEIEEMLYAQAFSGVDHFFFMATAQSDPADNGPSPDHDDFELDAELEGSHEIARLRIGALRAYDVRPWAIAQRVSRAS